MLILELAVQAVRGFSPSARIALRPGYVALKSPGEIPAPIAGLLLALCYPDGRGGDAAYLAPGQKAGRAGLSLQSDNQQVWRLVRDLGGAGALHRHNRDTGQFEVVTQDSTEMAQFLRATVGLPARGTFEQLFTLSASQLPSRQPKVKRAGETGTSKPGLAPSGFAAMPTARPAVDVETAKARIATLRAELEQSKTLGDVQFRFDGVQGEIFKCEEQLKTLEQTRARVAQARAQLERTPTLASLGLPEDIVNKVRNFSNEARRKDEQLARIEAERNALGDTGPVKVPSIFADQRFLAAMAVGLGLAGAGWVLGEGLRLIALVAVVPFSFAALLALRWIEDLQAAGRDTTRYELFAQREKKVQDEFQLVASIVQTALDRTNTSTTEEFDAVLEQRVHLEPEVKQLEAELARLEADPEIMATADTLQHLKLEQEELNEQLAGLGDGYQRDAREVEREIEALEESIAAASAPAPAPQITPEAAAFTPVPTGPTELFEDPMPGPIILASDLFGTDVPTLWGVLRERTLQYLAALTDRRYHGMDLDKDGHCTLEAPGRSVPAGELPARDLDLAWLALRLTLVEKYSTQRKVPLIIEDAFGAVIDGPKQPLFQRMLRHLGTLTQVLHVTGVGQNTGPDAVPV